MTTGPIPNVSVNFHPSVPPFVPRFAVSLAVATRFNSRIYFADRWVGRGFRWLVVVLVHGGSRLDHSSLCCFFEDFRPCPPVRGLFLDASLHLYNRLCPSVGWLVGWLVGRLVGIFIKNIKLMHFFFQQISGPNTVKEAYH